MKNDKFEADILFVPEIFSKLSIVDEKEGRFLKGVLDIIDSKGKVWDSYQVEIKSSENYPFSFPKLYEINNAFPKNADWHVYENDTSCCIDVPMSEIIICKNGLNIINYIKQFAVPYLANQSYRIREGYYLYGEYSHGIKGRIEYYQSILKANNLKQLVEMFSLIINDYNPDRRALCPFCHNEKFRKCHRDAFRDMMTIKQYVAQDGLVLLKILKANPDFPLPFN